MKIFWNFENRLLVRLTLLSVIPSIIVCGVIIYQNYSDSHLLAQQKNNFVLNIVETYFRQEAESHKKALERIFQTALLQKNIGLKTKLQKIHPLFPEWETIEIFNSEKKPIAFSSLKTKSTFKRNISFSLKSPAIAESLFVRGMVNLDNTFKSLNKLDLESRAILVFDERGKLLSSTGLNTLVTEVDFELQKITPLFKENKPFYHKWGGGSWEGTTKWIPDLNILLVVQVHTHEVRSRPNSQLYPAFLLFLLLFFVLPFLTSYISYNFSKPVKELAKASEEIAKGNYQYEIKVNAQDEMGTLSQNVNGMKITLEERLKSLEKSNEEKTNLLNDLKLLLIEKDRVAEKERQELSRLLHDNPLQNLGYLRSQLRKRFRSNCSAFNEIGNLDCWYETEQSQITTLLSQTEEELRKIVRGLRNETLTDLGLGPALEELIQTINERTGKQVRLTQEVDTKCQFGQEVENDLFGLIQEALNNFVKHADTDHCFISLFGDDNLLKVNIQDQGKGFDPHIKKEGHFGLFGMRSRADDLGCHNFTINSSKGKGTKISLELLRKTKSPTQLEV